jgi:hexosaminidase
LSDAPAPDAVGAQEASLCRYHDDGSVLQIDDEVVVDNDGNHVSRIVTRHIPLRHGLHRFKLEYFQAGGGATLRVRWAASEGELQPLTGAFLFH